MLKMNRKVTYTCPYCNQYMETASINTTLPVVQEEGQLKVLASNDYIINNLQDYIICPYCEEIVHIDLEDIKISIF